MGILSLNMATAVAPKAVSPLIKFCRYSALIGGLLYGRMRYNSLVAKEKVIQEEENKIRAIRDARLKAEKIAAVNTEMNNLAKDFGVQKNSMNAEFVNYIENL